jgi:NADH-quinone oxidoreductase subunit J
MMAWLLFAQDDGEARAGIERLAGAFSSDAGRILGCVILLLFGLLLLLPPQGRGKLFWVGTLLAAAGAFGLLIPTLVGTSPVVAFFLLEILVVLGAVGTITSRSPLYSAIWFAVTLLGVGAVLLLNGAQFLGIATVAVYAGAIVVTFLFVLMLSQPEGHTYYDRMSWGAFPMACAVLSGAALTGLIAWQISSNVQENAVRSHVERAVREFAWGEGALESATGAAEVRAASVVTERTGMKLLTVDLSGIRPGALDRHHAPLAGDIRRAVGESFPATGQIQIRRRDVLDSNHVAQLGRELFGRHLISVEIGGVLLLVALVGAFAMASSGSGLSRRSAAASKGLMS